MHTIFKHFDYIHKNANDFVFTLDDSRLLSVVSCLVSAVFMLSVLCLRRFPNTGERNLGGKASKEENRSVCNWIWNKVLRKCVDLFKANRNKSSLEIGNAHSNAGRPE